MPLGSCPLFPVISLCVRGFLKLNYSRWGSDCLLPDPPTLTPITALVKTIREALHCPSVHWQHFNAPFAYSKHALIHSVNVWSVCFLLHPSWCNLFLMTFSSYLPLALTLSTTLINYRWLQTGTKIKKWQQWTARTVMSIHKWMTLINLFLLMSQS